MYTPPPNLPTYRESDWFILVLVTNARVQTRIKKKQPLYTYNSA